MLNVRTHEFVFVPSLLQICLASVTFGHKAISSSGVEFLSSGFFTTPFEEFSALCPDTFILMSRIFSNFLAFAELTGPFEVRRMSPDFSLSILAKSILFSLKKWNIRQSRMSINCCYGGNAPISANNIKPNTLKNTWDAYIQIFSESNI